MSNEQHWKWCKVDAAPAEEKRLLDHNGNPIEAAGEAEKSEPHKHRFGHFLIPPDCHIKGFGSIGPTGER